MELVQGRGFLKYFLEAKNSQSPEKRVFARELLWRAPLSPTATGTATGKGLRNED